MPVSRTVGKMLFCPGCRARCWKGKKRLVRHMKNQCKSVDIRNRANGLPKDRTSTRLDNQKEYTVYLM